MCVCVCVYVCTPRFRPSSVFKNSTSFKFRVFFLSNRLP